MSEAFEDPWLHHCSKYIFFLKASPCSTAGGGLMKYNKRMQHHSPERNILHLFLFLIFASTLGWFINSYPPELLWQFGSFYVLLGLSAFFLSLFILCHRRRAILISIGLLTLFILRSCNLRHPFYIALLVLCLISIEYTSLKMRKAR